MMSRNRVLLASHHASRRGSAISLVELGIRLPQMGYEPVFLFSKEGPLAEALRTGGFSVYVTPRQGLLRWPLLRRVWQILRKERIVLAHVNSAVAFPKYVALAAKFMGVPVIWHIREPVEDKRFRRQRLWIRKLADRIVVLNDAQAGFIGQPEKTVKVFNGVDPEYFHCPENRAQTKRALGYNETTFLFIQIGSIERNKGQVRVLTAFSSLLHEYPEARLVLLGEVVGSDEEETMRHMLAADDRLRKAVRYVGSVQDVRPYLMAADCLLLPSLAESFPRTVLEAMACGVPVIASSIGALPEMIDKKTGWLISPGSVSQLVEAMRNAIEAISADRADYAQRCRETVMHRFSITAHVAKIVEIYNILTGR